MTFQEALTLARAWFSSPPISALSSDPYPVGVRQDLIYSPYGDVYTVAHALRDYVEWKRIAAAKSHFDANLSLINHHILPVIGGIPLNEFNGRHITQFSRRVLETAPKRGNQKTPPPRPIESLSPEELRKRKCTLNTLLGILRVAIQLAWENGGTDSERAWRCIRRIPNIARPRQVFLSRSECNRLLDACRDDIRKLVLGALYTGCRAGELCNLRVRDVAANVFGIYIAQAKNYRARYVFLPDEGMQFFLDTCEGRSEDELVFPKRNGGSWNVHYKHLYREAVQKAGLPTDFVFHGLRHTYASQLVQAGTPLVVVAQQLGHANTDTVSRTYGHLAPQIREAQIRSNFAPLDKVSTNRASENKAALDDLSKSLQGENWREYGAMSTAHPWPLSNFSRDKDPELGSFRRLISRP
ncbi:tyrosine-type recombinase/integrase [uncultured Aliiroseovarius sp.]|uniref:tyrosine-type recombinase/integrase n=1 Tax=Aliiroseovarius subalbicans TaxID=2925840 RepID=UPI00338F54A5